MSILAPTVTRPKGADARLARRGTRRRRRARASAACGGGTTVKTHGAGADAYARRSRRSSRPSRSCSRTPDRRSTRSSASASTTSRCSCPGARWPRTRCHVARPRLRRRQPGRVRGRELGAVRHDRPGRRAARHRRRPRARGAGAAVGDRSRRARGDLSRLRRLLGAVGEGVRAVRARGRHALQRPLHAAGHERAATRRALLVDLERAELRRSSSRPQAIDNSTVEVSPLLYRELLDAAWPALQATGHAGDTILIGEVAPRGQTTGDQPGNFSGMVPLRFIRALYCVDGSLHPLHGDRRDAARLPDDRGRLEGVPERATRGCSTPTGFAVHPYPQGQVTPNVRHRRPSPTTPTCPSFPTSSDARRGGRRLRARARSSRSTTPSSATRPTRPRRSRARSARRSPPTT